jgi:hypothetical protein
VNNTWQWGFFFKNTSSEKITIKAEIIEEGVLRFSQFPRFSRKIIGGIAKDVGSVENFSRSFYLEAEDAAARMRANGFARRLAPPTRRPSTKGAERRCFAFPGEALPP